MFENYKTSKEINGIWRKSVKDYKKEFDEELGRYNSIKSVSERKKAIENSCICKYFVVWLGVPIIVSFVSLALLPTWGYKALISYGISFLIALVVAWNYDKKIKSDRKRNEELAKIRKTVWDKVIERHAKDAGYSYERYKLYLMHYHKNSLLHHIAILFISASLTIVWVWLSKEFQINDAVTYIVACAMNIFVNIITGMTVKECSEEYYFESYKNDVILD